VGIGRTAPFRRSAEGCARKDDHLFQCHVNVERRLVGRSRYDRIRPESKSYRALSPSKNQSVFEVCIVEIGPVEVGPGRRVSVFKDDMEVEQQTARERVLRLLRGFRADDCIPPVEVVIGPQGYGYRYKLTHGTHRLYCALAAGFTHVPAVEGFYWQR
jgi:hypothetical protein